MDALKIAVTVTHTAAVREATGRAGREAVTLTPEILASIPETERAILATLLSEELASYRPAGVPAGLMLVSGAPLRLPTTDTSPEAVITALRAAVADKVQRQAAQVAEERAHLARVVDRVMSASIVEIAPGAVPWERWKILAGGAYLSDVSRELDDAEAAGIEGAGAARVRRMSLLEEIQTLATESTRRVALEWCARPLAKRVHRTAKNGWEVLRPVTGDARFAEATADEHYSAACPEYALAMAEAVAERKRLDAEDARIAEEHEIRRETLRGLWQEWALTRPELAPAAAEGYDVIGGCADDVAAQVLALAQGVPGVTRLETFQGGTKAWGRLAMADRKAPRPAAIAAQKTLAVGCGLLTMPEGMDAVVERVQRVSITTDGSYGDTETAHATALVVQLTSPITKPRAIVAFLE